MPDPDKDRCDRERFDRAVDVQIKVTLAVVVAAIPGLVLVATIFPPPWPDWLAIGYALLIGLAGGATFVRGRRRK